MVYCCHCVCQSMRFGEGNSNTETGCALVKETGERCSDVPSEIATVKEQRERSLLGVRPDQALLSHQLGLRVGDRVRGCSSLATTDKACSWVWGKFVLLFICFSLRVWPGKISWQSCEWSLWQKLDQDDVRQTEVRAWRRGNRWRAEANMWSDDVWG